MQMRTTGPWRPISPAAAGLAELVATACQVLAATGLAENILGHVSVRVGSDEVFVRCRGPQERGLRYTTSDDIRLLGPGVNDVGEWSPPNELPIHVELMRHRADITAVVHAHPPAVVAMSIAGLQLRPIVGAYDIPAASMAAAGIPVWPRAVLVNTPALGQAVAEALGPAPAAVLRGHGIVTVGSGSPEHAVAEAVVRAYALDSLARMTLQVRALGVDPADISPEDLRELPDLGSGLNVEAMWRHLTARAADEMFLRRPLFSAGVAR